MTLDEIYAELPRLDCQGKCAESCGPILMTPLEEERILERTGRRVNFGPDLTCNMLTSLERCAVYDIRPTICRLWGLVESMPCPWGCKPDRYLTDAEGHRILDRVAAIGGA